MTYRCDHILGDIEHWREDYYIMLTTADGRQGRLATGSIKKARDWVRQYEGSVAVTFIRMRGSEGYEPLKMQEVWGCRDGRCRNLTCRIADDHVDYDNYTKMAPLTMYDGQHQRRNTEAWL